MLRRLKKPRLATWAWELPMPVSVETMRVMGELARILLFFTDYTIRKNGSYTNEKFILYTGDKALHDKVEELILAVEGE